MGEVRQQSEVAEGVTSAVSIIIPTKTRRLVKSATAKLIGVEGGNFLGTFTIADAEWVEVTAVSATRPYTFLALYPAGNGGRRILIVLGATSVWPVIDGALDTEVRFRRPVGATGVGKFITSLVACGIPEKRFEDLDCDASGCMTGLRVTLIRRAHPLPNTNYNTTITIATHAEVV